VNKIGGDDEPTITGFTGNVTSKYSVETKVLGEGHYGTVRRCQDKETGIWFVFFLKISPLRHFFVDVYDEVWDCCRSNCDLFCLVFRQGMR
jgi:hypothetical protein